MQVVLIDRLPALRQISAEILLMPKNVFRYSFIETVKVGYAVTVM